MKRITKIWGIGLALVLVLSLLFSAAPVSSGTLSWGTEDLPDELEENSDIVDMDEAGGVLYAAIQVTPDGTGNDGEIFRSTNGGESWSGIVVVDNGDTLDAEFVAVAPDDENFVAAANMSGSVFISDDAGANWDTLGPPSTIAGSVRDLAVSPESGGDHVIAIATDAGEIWVYELGSIGADWDELSALGTFGTADIAGAVDFSRNFASDEVMLAVTLETNVAVDLQVFSFNQDEWNAGVFSDYPAAVVTHHATDRKLGALDSASIAVSPDYLGSDEAMRIVFVGLTTVSANATDEGSGIFRMDDDSDEVVKDDIQIHSVAFDGTRLAAGHYDSTNVRRSSDPLSGSPSASGATTRKRPGGTGMTVVRFSGDEVVAGTSGDESAFAVSTDDGKTFNDISIIDTDLDNLMDFAVTPDGEKIFLISEDTAGANDFSVWRYASRWERILVQIDPSETDYIIRLAPDDPDVVFVADRGGDSMFYSTNGGETSWSIRTSKEDITDLAIEGEGDVVYVLAGTHVSKSTNSGFTWGSKVSHKITDGGDTIKSMGEDEVLVGGNGAASYSTNGGQTWTKLSDGGPDNDPTQVVATGLDDGDWIFLANDDGDGLFRWEIGEDDEWDDVHNLGGSGDVYGMGLADGVLYVVGNTSPGVLWRSINPTADSPNVGNITASDAYFDLMPQNLQLSTEDSINRVWAIDTDEPALYSLKDTLAIPTTSLSSPSNASTIEVNPVSGRAFTITFTWENLSDKTSCFDFQVALDSGFDEKVLDGTWTKGSGTWDEGDIITVVVGPFVGEGTGFQLEFMPDTMYYWRVRPDCPIRGNWSETRTVNVMELDVPPPVIVEPAPPAPIIELPEQPDIVITPPEIVLPAPPAPPPDIIIPAPPPAPAPITPAYIWVIIIIGGVLVVVVIVLIFRTRRPQ
jgi:photosystem II stability/assembly factor-like uncharacterized protein